MTILQLFRLIMGAIAGCYFFAAGVAVNQIRLWSDDALWYARGIASVAIVLVAVFSIVRPRRAGALLLLVLAAILGVGGTAIRYWLPEPLSRLELIVPAVTMFLPGLTLWRFVTTHGLK